MPRTGTDTPASAFGCRGCKRKTRRAGKAHPGGLCHRCSRREDHRTTALCERRGSPHSWGDHPDHEYRVERHALTIASGGTLFEGPTVEQPTETPESKSRRVRWTEERNAELTRLWPTLGAARVAKLWGLSVDTVRKQARRLGLTRPWPRSVPVGCRAAAPPVRVADDAPEPVRVLAARVRSGGPVPRLSIPAETGLTLSEALAAAEHEWFEEEADGVHLSALGWAMTDPRE